MSYMVEIDGSIGEGGGQVLRTALSLSCLLRRPFRMHKIRTGRRRPGLMPQHLMCVRAATRVFRADVWGDRQGSQDLSFVPNGASGGDFTFDIGTAGSTSLVFQTLLAPLLFSGEAASITIRGGTHVPKSPAFDYIAGVFLPMLGRLGIRASAAIKSYGFYPRGGGEAAFTVMPCGEVHTGRFTDRGEFLELHGVSAAGSLPMHIAQRQRTALLEALRAPIKADVRISAAETPGRGTYMFLRARSEGALAGFSAIGMRGKRAEEVGAEAAREFNEYYASGACLDPYMADQIALYLSLAEGESAFTTSRITSHLMTNLGVIGMFTDSSYRVELPHTVRITGTAPKISARPMASAPGASG